MTTDDGHTIDVGYVHVLADDGECRPDCPHPEHEAALEQISAQDYLGALHVIRGLLDQLDGVRPDNWDVSLDEALDVWDQLERMSTDITVMLRSHATALGERMPEEYIHPRAGLVHTETEKRESWDGAGVIDALASQLITPEGEFVDAVPVEVLRQVIPASKPGAVSSKWLKTGLTAAGVDPGDYSSVTWGAKLVRRGPRFGRKRGKPALPDAD